MEQVKEYLAEVRSKGWEPVSAIVSQHGKTYCAYIYAMREAEGEWQYACFRYSTNQNVLRDEARVFPSVEAGRKDWRDLMVFLYPVPHVRLSKEEIA